MNDKHIEKLCINAGPLAIVLFFVGLFPLAHLLPPPINPGTPVEEVARFYRENRLGILFGEIFVMWGSCLMIPFMLAAFAHLRRVERGFPYLASIYLFCAVVNILEIIIAAWTFCAVVLHDRPDAVLLALSDLAWLMYVWPNPQTVFLLLAVGFAILRDPSPRPLFPRWLGYYNLAGGLLFFGSTFSNMAFSGPFSWTGLMAFWIPASDFGLWFILMFICLRKAVLRDDYEATRTQV